MSRDPRFVAANGQLLAVRRTSHDRLGGFSAVAHEIVDDVAFCRHAKKQGAKVVFADGTAMARCRMYDSARGVWEGFSKNIYEGIGGTVWALALVIALHLVVFVAPYVGLVAALAGWEMLLWPSLCGVAINMALRAVLALRYDQPPEGLILHPLSILALCAIAINSYRCSAKGRLTWAGRTYADRKDRLMVAS
jgi:chlorobactene glucosyltransferase